MDKLGDICSLEANNKMCNCTYQPCSRKGKCCECLVYHWSNNELPACLFPDKVEKTFDRSLKKFIEVYSGKK
ncbi:MAG: DUF6485 family protein [Chloroflexi bacterium]|nr:DUF6485 family protein [Chloroflexota bacterium]